MPLLKVILLAFYLTLFSEAIQAGEPGTKEDVKVQQQDQKKPEQTATKKETVKQKKPGIDYSKMTLSELKKAAKDKGISGYTTLKKTELIAALNQ